MADVYYLVFNISLNVICYYCYCYLPWVPCLFFAPAPVSAVPSAVQMASLVSEDPHHQTPHTPDTVAPTDLNETATELADWLLLITQMLKSNIVTVGDTEEIRTTMGRLQVRSEDVVDVFLWHFSWSCTWFVYIWTANYNPMSCTLYVTVSVCVCTSSWKVTKNDLEQRHPQLDDIFTLAQNIKNKTSNLDVRTSITEKCMYKAGWPH